MAYKSKYRVINEEKYKGNKENIICRSSWERGVCKLLDNSENIIKWGSEEISIKYFDPTTKRFRKYYPDFFFETKEGKKFLIEVKPSIQTKEPQRKRKTKRYYKELSTYYTNISKWKSAQEFCEKNNIHFEIWNENKLKKLGIRIIK